MSSWTMNCPNPRCKASLQMKAAPPPGTKMRCPRCDTTFEAEEELPVVEVVDRAPIGLAAEPEARCPSCQAVLGAKAVLCVACGYDLRTGKKVEGPKKAPRKGSRKSGGGGLSEEELPELVEEAWKLIELAHQELNRLPHVLGLGDDAGLAGLRDVANRPNRCDNPNCSSTLSTPGGAGWYTKVTFRALKRQIIVNLCPDCTEMLHADLASRDDTAKAYLAEARGDLERAARRFPDDRDVEKALREVRKVEMLAGEERARTGPGGRKRGQLCFIATAAYGSPLAAEVQTLRAFRDEVLERSAVGRWFVSVYYTLSPPLAALIARSGVARAVVRGLLRPVVRWCRGRTGPVCRGSAGASPSR
jgi:hypothetical protein